MTKREQQRLGKRLRRKREALGLTVRQLSLKSEAGGVSEIVIETIERGELASPWALRALARCLGGFRGAGQRRGPIQ